jgi:hypothetical protein
MAESLQEGVYRKRLANHHHPPLNPWQPLGLWQEIILACSLKPKVAIVACLIPLTPNS